LLPWTLCRTKARVPSNAAHATNAKKYVPNAINARKIRNKRNGQNAMTEAAVASIPSAAFAASRTLRALSWMETSLKLPAAVCRQVYTSVTQTSLKWHAGRWQRCIDRHKTVSQAVPLSTTVCNKTWLIQGTFARSFIHTFPTFLLDLLDVSLVEEVQHGGLVAHGGGHRESCRMEKENPCGWPLTRGIHSLKEREREREREREGERQTDRQRETERESLVEEITLPNGPINYIR